MNEVSWILRQARIDHGLSLEDVAQKTYIKLDYLEAIEEADFKRLPADVHVSGYIRQVARLFDLDGPGLASRFFDPGLGSSEAFGSSGQAAQPALPFGSVQSESGPRAASPTSAVQHLANLMESDAVPIREAKLEADAIVEIARAEARDLVRGAEAYAHDVLAKLEEDLSNTLSVIRNGRRYLDLKRYDGFEGRRQE
jgi:hypothetical protein